MSMLYGQQHRAMQQLADTQKLADRLTQITVATEISDEHKNFIESRDMFFLSTVDHRGYPTCSYKGGNPGFVRVIDSKTLAFPSYDGNGMYLSLGNMSADSKVGLLFIDFAHPHRVRVHGDSVVSRDDPLLETFLDAEWVVRVNVTEIFINCGRYIHEYQRVKTSRYVPQAGCETPFAQWKRIDAVQDSLPSRDKAITASLGEALTQQEYGALAAKGEF